MRSRTLLLAVSRVLLVALWGTSAAATEPAIPPGPPPTKICENELLPLPALETVQGLDWKTLSVKRGKNGGLVLEIEPIQSTFTKSPRASLELSPYRMFACSPEMAEWLGFKNLGGEKYAMPDGVEVQRSIDAFNVLLRENEQALRIAVRFYKTSKQVTSLEYLKRYARRGELPVADNGHFLLHDVNAHTTATLLPESFFEASRAKIKAFLEFARWVQKKHPQDLTLEGFNRIVDAVAAQLDFGLANIFQLIDRHGLPLPRGRTEYPPKAASRSVYDAVEVTNNQIQEVVGSGHSAQSYVQDIVDGTLANAKREVENDSFRWVGSWSSSSDRGYGSGRQRIGKEPSPELVKAFDEAKAVKAAWDQFVAMKRESGDATFFQVTPKEGFTTQVLEAQISAIGRFLRERRRE